VAIDREKTLAAAQKYVDKKRYDRAVIEFQRILQEDPNDARILLKLGDVQSKMGAHAEAVATYERVGKFYASQGFSLKAIAVYKQIREIIARHLPHLDDKYAHIAPKLAELYQQLGLTSDALAALDEVATRLQRQNRDQEAIEVFRKLVELDPSNPLPHLRLAEALSRVKEVESAVLEFGLAAGQLVKLGRRDDALKVIERLLFHKADASYARIAAEQYLARGGTTDGMQALAKLQVCFQANPRDLDTLGLLARAFTQIGQAAKAVEVQKEMARLARESGKMELFHELTTKLVKLAPNDEGVRQLLAAAASATAPAAPPARPTSHQAQGDAEDDEGPYEDVGDGDIQSAQPIELARRSALEEIDEEVVTGSSVELVDEAVESQTGADAREHVARILAEVAAHRRSRRHGKALEALQVGVRLAPKSLQLHEALRDVLLDAGRTQEAIAQMILLAELLVEGLDGEAAAHSLQDALALDPNNAVAARMLSDLGYELVEEPLSSDNLPQDGPELAAGRGVQPSSPEAPLPSYDLEEIGPDDVAVRSYSDPRSEPQTRAAMPAGRHADMGSIDDPFGDGSLPAYPLEGGSDRPRSGPPRGVPELEAALEEADFFASRGLFDDARTILEEQLARLPNHPLLRDRLTELDAQERSVRGGSGTRPSPAAATGEDRAFDIAESLSGLDMESPASVAAAPTPIGPTQQVDVEEVFAQFKAGVAKQIGVDDAQSHYDLGVAYREMALLDDAMREFETAARDGKRACVCHSMIGMIQLERGDLNEAIESFLRALDAPVRTKEQEASLSYEIGAAYEAMKLNKQALDYFQRAARLVPSFRDVQERVRKLQKPEAKQQPARAVAVGADDEFDRAFDTILGEDKRAP
jgi:tetratricopeptide (TPR) repeat protein